MRAHRNATPPRKRHPRRRNGDVIDLAARRSAVAEKAAEAKHLAEAAKAPAYPRTAEGLKAFVEAHVHLGILAADLATAFRIPVSAADQMLEEMEKLDMLDSAEVNGVHVWYQPGHPPEAVQQAQAAEQKARMAERAALWKLPADVLPQTAKRGDRVAYLERHGSGYRVTFGTASADDSGYFDFRVARQQPGGVFKTEAGARRSVAEWIADRWAPQAPSKAEVAKYAPNDVVVIRGGRRRYVIAALEPNYGGEQTYMLTALSGGDAGSVPTGVPEREISRAKDRELRWEGEQGHRLWQKYAQYMTQFGKTPDLIVRPGTGEIRTDPGVALAQRLRYLLGRSAAVSQPKRGQATAWVTVPIKPYPHSARDLEPFSKRLWEVYERIVQAGHTVSSIEAGHGRIVVVESDDPRYGMPAEKVWEEFAKAAHMSGEKANPARRMPAKRANPAPVDRMTTADVQRRYPREFRALRTAVLRHLRLLDIIYGAGPADNLSDKVYDARVRAAQRALAGAARAAGDARVKLLEAAWNDPDVAAWILCANEHLREKKANPARRVPARRANPKKPLTHTITARAEDGTPFKIVVPAHLPTEDRAEVLRALYGDHVRHPGGHWKGEAVAEVPVALAPLVAEAMNFMGSTVDRQDRLLDGRVRIYSRGYWAHGF